MRTTRRARRSLTRLRTSFLIVAFVLSLFAARLFQLQGVDANAYAQMAEAEGSRTVTLHAERGVILDRNGVELASSVDAVALTADPTLTMTDAPAMAAVLLRMLGLDYFTTVQKLRTPDSRFVYLDRRVPTWRADAVQTALDKAGLPMLYTERDPLRTYPAGSVGANLLGVVQENGNGASGLENWFNDTLKGTDGQATYEVSPTGEQIPLADSSVQEPQPGIGVQTTIDRDVQWFADRRLRQAIKEHGADWGVAITTDVRTGQIIQFSQYPTFDPNRSSTVTPDRIGSRGVQFVYEPGSVEKVLTFSALTDAGVVTPRTKISVPGSLWIDGNEVNDDWVHGRIGLTATGVVAMSSNLGTIVASNKISDRTLYRYLRGFGFGEQTGVQLPGESRGLLPDVDGWADINHATIAFGQGVSVTSIQMAAAISAVANGGMYIQPTLVSGAVDANGDITPAGQPKQHRVISQKAAAMVAKMMQAVTQDGGTAPLGAIPGYLVAGKTGTAERVNPVTGRYDGTYTISFAGFAPADDPRFMTYVVLDNPKDGSFGGTAAAPVFHDIMSMVLQRYGVPPTGAKQGHPKLEW